MKFEETIKVLKRGWWILLLFFTAVFYLFYIMLNFPDYDRFKYEFFRLSDGVVLDRDLYPLSYVRQDFDIRRIDYVKLSEINSNFIQYLIKSEDKRFYSHFGIDIISILSSIKDFLIKGKRRGASTIDMQFVRNYFKLQKESLIIRKIKEVFYSLIIEIRWNKEDILEAYLNTVPIRGEISGIYTASWGLFNKSSEFLNEIESVILLSLIRKPAADRDQLFRIAKTVSKSLSLKISDEMLHLEISKLPERYILPRSYNYLPVLSERLLNKYSSPVIITIDIDIQKNSIEILKSFVSELRSKNLTDASLLIVENRTGEILAYVPNSIEYTKARYVDGVTAKRQAGSTLKPFLYEYLIENKILTAASVLEDLPLFVGKEGMIYSPQNYDKIFNGYVSVRTALASSLNLPAVRSIMLSGVENYTSFLKRLGFDVRSADNTEDYYGESLALGTLDVSLFELVQAYTIIANKGLLKRLKFVRGEKDQEIKVMDERGVYIIQDILSDRDARSLTFDLENTLSTPFYTAVKTGTSKDMRDNWCIGFSEKYTVGVWTGNFSGEPMYNVSGSHGASQIWFSIMKRLHKRIASNPPPVPPGIVKQRIKYNPSIEPERDEIFISGTEPATPVININTQRKKKILYPPDGAIFAYDPEIPGQQQKIFIYSDCFNCYILNDDRPVQRDRNIFIVDVIRGRHTIQLVDLESNILDNVTYEVR